MKIKEKDKISNADIFILENGEPVKKKYYRVIKK